MRVALRQPHFVTERQYVRYVERLLDAFEAMGFTEVHVGASLRDKTIELAMDNIEARTAKDAQDVFAHIVERATAAARPALLEPGSDSLEAEMGGWLKG
ncbi:hypothetical protein ACIBTP_40000 [Streptomyces avidinii]|uniref:hypothetical protein n=1 Tax=Streptomyces avidinii TaxID=1895 RepID=UPI00379D290D